MRTCSLGSPGWRTAATAGCMEGRVQLFCSPVLLRFGNSRQPKAFTKRVRAKTCATFYGPPDLLPSLSHSAGVKGEAIPFLRSSARACWRQRGLGRAIASAHVKTLSRSLLNVRKGVLRGKGWSIEARLPQRLDKATRFWHRTVHYIHLDALSAKSLFLGPGDALRKHRSAARSLRGRDLWRRDATMRRKARGPEYL